MRRTNDRSAREFLALLELCRVQVIAEDEPVEAHLHQMLSGIYLRLCGGDYRNAVGNVNEPKTRRNEPKVRRKAVA